SLAGYRQAAGGATAGVNRVVARVGPAAAIDLSTQLPADVGVVRATASADGLGYYLATSSGVRYVPFGSPADGATLLSPLDAGPDDLGGVLVGPDGRLYALRSAGGPALVGAGLPIVGGQTIMPLPGFPDGAGIEPGEFVLNPAGTTIYLADARTDGNGGLVRYQLVNGQWTETAAYRFPAAGLRALTADFTGVSPVVYGVTAEASAAANRLVRFSDAGGSSIAAPTVLATAAADTAFRGVALSPVAAGAVTTTTTLTAGATSGVYGTGVTLTARVSGRAGPRGPGGVVSFRAGGREIGAAVLVNGSATFATVGNLPASATPADVVAVYTGDPTYAGSTSAARSVTITKAATSTTLAASPNPAVQGTDVVLTAALTVPAGTLPTGTVTFRAGADVLGTAPVVVVVEGRSILFRAALTVRFVTPGDRTLTAEYGGDGNFQPGTSDGLVQSVTAAAGAIAFGAAGFDAIADPGTVYLTLTRTGGTAGAVTVEGYTADGTAAAGTDFVGILPGAPFTVSFADGQTTALLPVTLLLPPAPYAGTRTFTVTLQSPTGGATLGGRSSAAVTLTDPVLRVVSKPVVDGSSIRLNFNRKVDPGPVNLYAGPADLVVLDAGTGQPSAAVAGSLVLDPGGTTATFVNTAGAVPAGSYRVRLAADADGRPAFRGLDGRALDGDGDDAPGGDFTSAALDVAAPAGPVLAVGGFARGAGQAVQLPVTIRGAGTVTQVSFQLAYDPTLLTVPATGAVTLAGGTGMTLGPYSVTVLDARRAVLAVSAAGGAGWNPPDGAAVVTVAASVPDDALYGGAAVLDLGTVQVNDAQAVAADGVHAAAYPGDADADRAYSALDAALIARSGGGVGLAAFDDLDPVLIGDLDGDGVMDPELVARRAVGQTVPQLPDRPAGAAPAPTGTGPKLYFADAVARPGGTVTVSLRLAVADPAGFPLAALDLAVGFDPAVLSVGNVRGGSLFGAAADWTTVAAVDNGAGVLRVGLFTARPLDLTQGKDGEVLRFDVTVRAATPVGTTTPLNLLAAAGPTATDRTVTAVGRTAGLRLPDPAPTDGSDVGVDGLVSVVAEANRPPTVTARDVGTGRPSRLLFNPADAPGLRTAAANTFPFAGADAITVDDPDGGSVTVTVGLTGAAGPVGVLTATAAGAATVTGNGTEAVTIAGPLADVNATLGSLVYRPGAGYFGRTAVTASADDGAGGTAAAATAVEAVGLFVSEVMLGPANVWAMGPYQYVEVFSTAPDYDIPAGVYLVGVEGDNGGAATNDPGRVQDVFALGPVGAQPGFRTGPNGYLALLPKAAGYEAAVRDPAGVVAENAGTGGGFGNGGGSSAYPTPGGPKAGVHAGPSAGGARDGSPANEGTGNLERASASYLLVRTAAAPTSATDIDPGNDGVPDGGAYDGWTVLDGVAVLDGVNGTAGPDRAYAPVVFRSSSSNGTAPAGAAVVETHAPGNQWVGGPWTATYAGRVGRSTGYAAADWLAAVADQARGAIRLHSLRSTAFAGQVLAHVGGPNFFAPTATVVVNDGRSAQRSLVSSVAVRFDLPVAVADPGAFRLRTAGGVYLDIIVTDAATGRPLAAGATGVREVRLAPRPGSPFTVAFARPDPWGYSVGLADGNYFVEVRADAVTANGVRLDGDRDGSAGGDLSAQVFRFFGDVNGDRYVDRVDDGRFGAAFGGKPTDPADPVFFDVNQDGVLDATDRAAFLKNRARNLPPA
ncbi:MAG: Ig-like domain repeat protein, partial [Gemmataceae bacterium]|nr:Ig-like domain repeat protein [Gemmataceae bacterium]